MGATEEVHEIRELGIAAAFVGHTFIEPFRSATSLREVGVTGSNPATPTILKLGITRV